VSVRRDIVANYLGTGVSALLPILALPWYVRALGAESWGLVSFVGVIVALLGLIDAGLGQALVRELATRAHRSETKDRRPIADLIFGFERVYWGFALVAGGAVLALAHVIGSSWLRNEGGVTTGTAAIAAAGALFFAQFPGALYRSVLVALERQVELNKISVGFSAVRHIGCVFLLQIAPELAAYLLWQVLFAAAETVTRGWAAWRASGESRRLAGWNGDAMRAVAMGVAGMSGAVLLSALTAQLDRVFLSRMVPMDQFAAYAIASSLAIGVLQVIYPVTQAVMPKLVVLPPSERRRLSLKVFAYFVLLMGVGCVAFAFVGESLLRLWLRDAPLAAHVFDPLRVLLVGTLFNALYNVGYMNWIAKGRTRLILLVNLISIAIALLFIPRLISVYGIVGAAAGWLIMNVVGFLLSLDWLSRRNEDAIPT
jgi:O-antigen/teichoic acid export membrane protein